MARRMKLQPKVEAAPKKRGRPRKAQMPLSNVTDETIRQHVDAIVVAERDVRLARERLAAKKEAAKDAGVTLSDVTWFLRQRDRDVRDIDAETRRRNRLAKIMGLPLGTQLGLFEDGESVATKIETATKPKIPTLADLQAARVDGNVAARRGEGADKNPHPEGSGLFLAWEEGRREGTARRAAEVFGDAPSAEDIAGEAVDGMRALRAEAAGNA